MEPELEWRDKLRRDIAERLGWHEVEEFTYWREDYEDMFEMQSLRGIAPSGEARVEVPDWTADAGAALALCAEIGFFSPTLRVVGVAQLGDSYEVFWLFPSTNAFGKGTGNFIRPEQRFPGDTLAIALSRLALATLIEKGE